jgi:hypothetical protein
MIMQMGIGLMSLALVDNLLGESEPTTRELMDIARDVNQFHLYRPAH